MTGAAAVALRDAEPAVFWLDAADRPVAREPLAGAVETDLAVVGGGCSGLWTAVLAKQDGLERLGTDNLAAIERTVDELGRLRQPPRTASSCG